MSIKPISSYSPYQTQSFPQLPPLPQWSPRQIEISPINFNPYMNSFSYPSSVSTSLSFSPQFSPLSPSFQSPPLSFQSTFSSLSSHSSPLPFTLPSNSSSLMLPSSLNRPFTPPVHELPFDRGYNPISWHNPSMYTLNFRPNDSINSSTDTIFRKSIDSFRRNFQLASSTFFSPPRPLFSAEDQFLQSRLQEFSSANFFQSQRPLSDFTPSINHNPQYISPQERVQVLDANGNVESYPLLDNSSTSMQPLSNSSTASTSFGNRAVHLLQDPQTGAAYLSLSEMNMGFPGKAPIVQNIMINLSEANAGYAMNQLGQNSYLNQAGYSSSIVPSEEVARSLILLKLNSGTIEPADFPILDLGRCAFSLVRGACKAGIPALFKAQTGATKDLVKKITAPSSSGNASNCVSFEKYKTILRTEMEKPHVVDCKLEHLIKDVYRPNANIGSGSTAAAIRHELSTGEKVFGKFHSQKGRDTIVALEGWLKNNPTARAGDRAAAENIIKDLQNALGK